MKRFNKLQCPNCGVKSPDCGKESICELTIDANDVKGYYVRNNFKVKGLRVKLYACCECGIVFYDKE